MPNNVSTYASALVLAILLPATASAQAMTLAVQPAHGNSGHSLWTWHEDSATLQPGPVDVTFLPVELGGYAAIDSLRQDRPALAEEDSVVPHIRLPGGGSLYNATVGSDACLVHVRADGTLQTLLTIPSLPGVPAELLTALHVSTDGAAAIVASSKDCGGDVYVLDLQTGTPPRCLTTLTPPLSVEDTSLRVSNSGAFFVADDNLYRADLDSTSDAAPVDLQLGEQPAQPELAVAPAADHVAVVVGDNPLLRQIVVVGKTGPAVLVTDTPDDYDTPNYDHPLGPWLALSHDGSLLAYRCTLLDRLELFVRETNLSLPSLHVTIQPDFHDCIDNVGILGFDAERWLTFFTGDVIFSGITNLNIIAMGEVFAADFSSPGAASYYNVSLTTGVHLPPYHFPGNLYFTDAYYDPTGQNVIMVGPDATGVETLSTFVMDSSGAGSTVASQLTTIDDEPLLMAVGQNVMVVSESEAESSESEADLGLLTSSVTGGFDLSALLSVPDGLDVDRFTSDGSDAWTALVVSVGEGQQLPVLVNQANGALALPTWPTLLEVSPGLAFSSSGTLYFGVGAVGGPYVFVSWNESLGAHVIPSLKGHGFPLGH